MANHSRTRTRLAVWELPRRQCWYVIVVHALALVIAGYSIATTPLRMPELAIFAVLTGCGAASVEAVRRLGEPAGVSKDLLVAWTLPVALLLPPVYGILAPAILYTLMQIRVRRTVLYRRTFTIASVSIADTAAGVLFRAVTGAGPTAWNWTLPIPVIALAGLGCGLVLALINTTLIAVAVGMSSPEESWWNLVRDRRMRLLDGLEITTALAVTLLCAIDVLLVPIVLPPVLFLQRSLLHDELRAAARTDAKTGVLNATAWNREAEREIIQAARTRQPLAVLLLDIDHFKRINDAHGHLLGDQMLKAIAATIQHETRTYDVLGRFGGEEFVLLLPATGPPRARAVADRLRERLRALTLLQEGQESIRVTVSIGVALLGTNGTTLVELLTAADSALYQAKTAGRDRTHLAEHTSNPKIHRLEHPRDQWLADTPACLWFLRPGVENICEMTWPDPSLKETRNGPNR